MIEKITIRNFKSLGEVTVDLEPVTVFIGRSGVGKSNFLRAIRFLRNFLKSGQTAINVEGGWERIRPFRTGGPLSFEVTYRLPGFSEPFVYRLLWQGQRQAPHVTLADESLMYGTSNIFSGDPGLLARAQTKLGQLPTKTEAVLSFAALTVGIGWHDFPSYVFASAPAHGAAAEKGLDDGATNHLTVLKDLTQDLRDQQARRQVIARLRQVNPSIESLELNSILNPQNAIVGHKLGNGTVAFDLSQESDGLRRYLAHLLAIYQTPPKQLLMFEEPENGIAPGALKSLSEEFIDAPNHMRGQILLTTQSPDLLDGFEAKQIRVVEIDEATQLTKIGPLDLEQVEAVRDQLLRPGELLTVDQARLMPEKVHAS